MIVYFTPWIQQFSTLAHERVYVQSCANINDAAIRLCTSLRRSPIESAQPQCGADMIWKREDLVTELGQPYFEGNSDGTLTRAYVRPPNLIPNTDRYMRWECGCAAVTGLIFGLTIEDWLVVMTCPDHLSMRSIPPHSD
jgi:hypothetical protein